MATASVGSPSPVSGDYDAQHGSSRADQHWCAARPTPRERQFFGYRQTDLDDEAQHELGWALDDLIGFV